MSHRNRVKALHSESRSQKDSFLNQSQNGKKNSLKNLKDLSQTFEDLINLEQYWNSVKSGADISIPERSNTRSSLLASETISSENSERKNTKKTKQSSLFDMSKAVENLNFGRTSSSKKEEFASKFFGSSNKKDYFQ